MSLLSPRARRQAGAQLTEMDVAAAPLLSPSPQPLAVQT